NELRLGASRTPKPLHTSTSRGPGPNHNRGATRKTSSLLHLRPTESEPRPVDAGTSSTRSATASREFPCLPAARKHEILYRIGPNRHSPNHAPRHTTASGTNRIAIAPTSW